MVENNTKPKEQYKVQKVKEEMEGLEEKFNMESIPIETLERLVCDLNKDHAQIQYQS